MNPKTTELVSCIIVLLYDPFHQTQLFFRFLLRSTEHEDNISDQGESETVLFAGLPASVNALLVNCTWTKNMK